MPWPSKLHGENANQHPEKQEAARSRVMRRPGNHTEMQPKNDEEPNGSDGLRFLRNAIIISKNFRNERSDRWHGLLITTNKL